MPRDKDLREQVEKVDEGWILGEIAQGIDLGSAPADKLTRGQQWKIWLTTGEKTGLDLIDELSKAPGRPRIGQPIDHDIPVPFYEPGPVQWEAHKAKERVVLVAGGWRAGKSKWLAAQLLPFMFRDYAHVWIVANDYHLARAEFEYVLLWLQWLDVPLDGPPSQPKEGSFRVETKWHAVIETRTGKDENKVEMDNLNACGIAEAGQTSESLLTKVRGRVFQKRGRIFISGSLTAAQPWYVNALKRFPNGDGENGWRSFSIPSYDNRAVFPLGENDPEIGHMRREMPPEEFARKVLALPVRPEGLVFGEFSEDIHVVPIRYFEINEDRLMEQIRHAYSPFAQSAFALQPIPVVDKGGFAVKSWEIPETCDIELAIDPGWEHAYAVLAIARFKDMVLVVDEVYTDHMHVEDIIQECKSREWWPRVKGGVIDVAGKQHMAQKSQHEIWRDEAKIYLKTQMVPIEDGISRYRTFLFNPDNRRPRLYVDPRCDRLIWEHSNYKYHQKHEDRPIREAPIDANNHAIKALTYFLVVNYDYTDRKGGTTSRKYLGPKVRTDRAPFGDEESWGESAYRNRRTIRI